MTQEGNDFATQQADQNATVALICALVGIFLCGIVLEPVAIYLARKSKAVLGQGHPSYGKANAAEIIGWIMVALWVLGLCLTLCGVAMIPVFGGASGAGGSW